jgi:hypothetical protein
MKRGKWILVLFVVLCLAATPAMAQSRAQSSFDRLKSLVGEWEGVAGEGKPAKASYRLVSNGSTLEETLKPGEEDPMITVYHLDGDRIMVTHYCGAGNQPRMVTSANDNTPNVFAFKFLDATNMAGPGAGHMRDLTVTLVDKDHLTQQWYWSEKGKQNKMELFKLTRKH